MQTFGKDKVSTIHTSYKHIVKMIRLIIVSAAPMLLHAILKR